MPQRIPFLPLANPPRQFALGSVITYRQCLMCPPGEEQHDMVNQVAFCRDPACPRDCLIQYRVRRCLVSDR